MKQLYLFIVMLAFCGTASYAQTKQQNSAWFFLMNSSKINDKWGIHFDGQFRYSSVGDGVRSTLIRPGLTYFLDKRNDLTLGYLYTKTHVELPSDLSLISVENRIWEQYIHKHKIGTLNLSHRFRLEQRFLDSNLPDTRFAQRARYFVRALLPLKKTEGAFDQGMFLALQNEVFLNVQGKDKLNGSLFDQNRAYLAAGYRFSESLDGELGYMNQRIKGVASNTSNNIVQLAIYTRF